MKKLGIGTIVLFFVYFKLYGGQEIEEFELTPQDGYYNNLLHPDWGAIDGQLLRPSRPDYSDSVFEPSGTNRPNPFEVSDVAHFGDPGNGSARGRNSLLVFFGQQVVEEIMDSQRPGCPREFFNVKVPTGHRLYDPEGKGNIEMPLLRTRFDQRTGYSPNNPRQQLNEITPYIDGGLMYGTSKAWTDTLRSFKNGELLAEGNENNIRSSFPNQNDIRLPMANPPPPREHKLKPVNRFYRLGNPRGNENPMLLTFGVMWFRWHNVVARKLKGEHPDWSDEQLFNRARQFVIAHHQNIVMYDWLPKWIRIDSNMTEANISDYTGYKPNVHPGISQEFQTAALRFGHTLVPSGIFTRRINGDSCDVTSNIITNGTGHRVPFKGIRVCTSYWNSQEPLEEPEPGIDSVFLGMIYTLSEKEDHIIVTDLRGNVFGPLDFNQRDLAAINIQRGRDHGLPGYNEIRQTYGLDRIENWSDINDNTNLTEILNELQRLYNNDASPDNLDVFTGGLLETTEDGLGPLFTNITIEQFERIRSGDRFWFENKNNGIFNDTEIEEIKQVHLRDIIIATTNIGADQIPESVFLCRKPVGGCNCMSPFNQSAIKSGLHEQCVPLSTFDYFSGSEASFALTFVAIGLCVPLTIGIMIWMAKHKEKKMAEANRRRPARSDTSDPNKFFGTEWVGIKSGERNVKVELDRNRKKIMVTDRTGKTLRLIDLRRTDRVHIRISDDKDQSVISVRVPGETDLIIRFQGLSERQTVVSNIDKFLQDLSINRERHEFTEATIMKDADTFDNRKKLLDTFFKVICLQAFKKEKSAASQLGIDNLDLTTANEIRKIKLTRTEFAEALGLQPDSLFVRNMFLLVDRSKDGFVSFEEFLSMFVTMASGGAEDKARLLFNMYDLKRKGELTRKDFTKMIRSMMDLADATLDDSRVDTFLDHMFEQAGIANKQTMTFDDFKKIFASEEHSEILQNATLAFDKVEKKNGGNSNLLMRKKTVINRYRDKTFHPQSRNRESKIHVEATKKQIPMGKFQTKMYEITRYIENYRLHIFWFILFNLVTLGIFIERAYYYSVEREHAGLRRLAGYGVSVTRGAASVQMFLYVSLLVTMSRNTLTFFRETFLHRFIPFDSFHAMHKYTALMALIFTAMHIIGHAINLYHISTQASSDLNCYFREYFRATDVLASFHYWAFTTITGITGVILTLIIIVMYVFATEYGRRHLFNAFWFTHNFYIFLYIFLILHGIGRLVQDPLFPYFFLGPMVVFILDKMVSLSRNKVEIVVKKAEILPSGVTNLVFKRPLNFDYKSGQWVRIACLDLGESEYHPFTLTSAPQEENLSLHIRAVGPWTTNIRRVYDPNNIVSTDKSFPKLYLDGPFGEGHQDWYRYPVAVLVGGGIGVTPFASILKDLVQKSKMKVKFPCQKVYFLWVTRTQKSFEWMTDIIREVELGDINNLVSVHIFITQFQQKFDLRTTMLYICERHFQKVAGQSLFTGLRATTHFGRPKFQDFLLSLAHEHDGVPQVGVFSCGPPPMTSNVDKACSSLNKLEGPTYVHHFENF